MHVVPVLDATDLDKPIVIPSGLSTVQKDYPHFGRTVPSNSIALVAYTVGQYKSSHTPNEKSLSFNLIWAAVLFDGGE